MSFGSTPRAHHLCSWRQSWRRSWCLCFWCCLCDRCCGLFRVICGSAGLACGDLGGLCHRRGDRCGCRLCRGLCGGSLIRGRIDALTTTRLCTVPCHVFPVRLARSHVGPHRAKSVTITAWAGKHVGGLQQQSKQNKTRHFSKISLFDRAGFEPKCFCHQWQSMVCRKWLSYSEWMSLQTNSCHTFTYDQTLLQNEYAEAARVVPTEINLEHRPQQRWNVAGAHSAGLTHSWWKPSHRFCKRTNQVGLRLLSEVGTPCYPLRSFNTTSIILQWKCLISSANCNNYTWGRGGISESWICTN